MSNNRGEKRAFKVILRAIASDDLSNADYSDALHDLRDGSMIKILDDIFATLSGNNSPAPKPSRSKASPKPKSKRQTAKIGNKDSVDALFDDIKRRKINRARLNSIIGAIDGEFLRHAKDDWTIRELVSKFSQQSSDRQWNVLSSIINGEFEKDSYLDDIARI